MDAVPELDQHQNVKLIRTRIETKRCRLKILKIIDTNDADEKDKTMKTGTTVIKNKKHKFTFQDV
jgi:hypothetical protein